MVGGNREIRVHHNIFSQSPAPINVELKYEVQGGQEATLQWDGRTRNIAPQNLASVFDSSYTNDLLERRSADTAIVRPLGLHLFTALTSAMDKIKERLAAETESIVKSLPQIAQDNLGQVIKTITYRREYSTEQKKYITERYVMTEESQKALADCEKAYKELMATNYDDRIKVIQGEQYLVKGLKDHLQKCSEDLKKSEEAVVAVFANVKKARKEQEEARQKIRILGEIGNTDSKEWLAFIQSGAAYQAKSTIGAGTCPYCRQPLEGKAKDLVKAYSDFLGDKTAAAYTASLKKKTEWKEYISHYATHYALTEPLLNVLAAQANGEEIKTYVEDCLRCFAETKKALLASFEKKEYQRAGLPEGNGALGMIVKNYDEALKKLIAGKAEKEEKLKKLNETRQSLLEHKAIAEQRAVWEQWFEPLFEAINRKQVVEVTYSRFMVYDSRLTVNRKERVRVIHPYQLRQYNNRWYLVGKEERLEARHRFVVLPIDRMSDVKTAEGVEFRAESSYQIERNLKYNVGVSVLPEGRVERVRVKAWSWAVEYLETKPLHESQRVVETPSPDGTPPKQGESCETPTPKGTPPEQGESCKVFEWEVMVNEELIQQLLVYADQCEILEPESLKRKISERAKAILRNNDENFCEK